MLSTTHITEEGVREVQRIFELQKAHQYVVARSSDRERRAKLKNFQRVFLKYRSEIKEALNKDFKKHPTEVDLTETYPVVSELKHARRHISTWMGKHRVPTPITLLGARSYIKHEPKGVALILSPWNFPINLTFCPMISAIAAGNTVILKPSEHTPNASVVMKQIISEAFEENEVTLIEGGIETAQALLELPFNHIFFTGSTAVGKIIMTAAAKNLASVTLELGGKSPTIVDETASIKLAARRIAWAKFMNNGQICLSPDYVYVHKSKLTIFVKAIKEQIQKYYGANPSEATSYSRIVNENHFERLKAGVNEAVKNGANVENGAVFSAEENYIAPTILTNVGRNADLMKNEIFGPILPVYSYTDINSVMSDLNGRPKPLALYIYSKSKKNADLIIQNTRAGATCVNHNGVHFYNPHLPFGGSNESGIGKSHGWFGFQEFSNARSIMAQKFPGPLERMVPPYNQLKQHLINVTIRYL